MPRISIILPTYNRVALLPRAIQSVIDQSFTDWELIVVNDASTDTTDAVARNFSLQDSRIRVITNVTNQYPDISKTLNIGCAEARGEYIARLDDDDFWHDRDKLKVQIEFLDTHPECVLLGAGVIVIDAEGKERTRYQKPESDAEIRATALLVNPFAHTTVMYRASAARQVGWYSNIHYAEDWDLWLKLGTVGKMGNLQRYTTSYLQAGQNKSLMHLWPHTRNIFAIITTHRKQYPHALRAYLITTLQYTYALLIPLPLRAKLQPIAATFKRSLFG